MADVSVVIPTRRRPALVAEAIASVRAQVGVEVEIVVVADDDARPRGPAATRNLGIARAAADHIAFLDDDDTWLPDKLVRQLVAIDGHEWCTTGVVVGGRYAPPPSPDATFRRRNDLYAGASTVLVARQALVAVGGFDESLPASEDWDLWIRLAARGPLSCVDAPLATYRRRPGSLSGDPAIVDTGLAAVVGKHGLDLDRDWSLLYRAGGRRGVAAATLYAEHACRCRRPRSVARAAAALLGRQRRA